MAVGAVSVRDRLAASWRRLSQARDEAGLNFWKEAALVVSVYASYGVVRNLFGSASVGPDDALRNADRIIELERALGTYIEPTVQSWFIDWTGFVQFWNLFYGVFHFLITFVVLLWLYFARSEHFRFWRRAGLITTVSSIIGFAVFPLMPPRLLGDCGPFGACRAGSPYVDTVIEIGGIWSFETPAMESISNQYAAMPSLHIGWALWSALAVLANVRRPWVRVLAIIYPVLTLFAIVVTANHYWFDAVGGVAVVGIGWCGSWLVLRRRRRGSGAIPSESGPAHTDDGISPLA